MPVFNIPKEYYGLVGIGEAIGTASDKYRQRTEDRRRREREDFVFEDAKLDRKRQEEQDIIRRYGQGSERHVKWATENGIPPEGIIKPIETRNQERLTFLETKPEETLTEAEKWEKNLLLGKPGQGIEGLLAEHKMELGNKELMYKVNKLALAEAEMKVEQRKETRRVLAETYGTTPEKIDALMQIIGYKQAQANLGLTNEQIRSTRALAKEREADAASVAATGGYDKAQIRQLTTALNTAKVTGAAPFSSDFVAKGLARTLTGDDQRRFDVAWQHYNLKEPAAEVNKAIQENDKKIAGLRARRRIENKADPKKVNQDNITAIDAEIAELEQNNKTLRSNFEATKRGTYQAAAGRTSAQVSSTGTSAAPVGNFPPALKQQVLSDYSSIADIDADPDASAEEKEILKSIFVAASAQAEPAPQKATPSAVPPKAAPVSRNTEGSRVARAVAEDRNRAKVAQEKERLERQIAKLERDIEQTRSYALATKADKAKIPQWRAELERKRSRLSTVNELLRSR